MITKNSLKCYY